MGQDLSKLERKRWWQPTKPFTEENMKEYVGEAKKFEPPYGAKCVNIMLLGLKGHGKSSYISTIMSAFVGKISNPANAIAMDQSATRRLRYHEFIYTGGGHEYKTAFRIIDTMGITDNYELHSNDIANIMKGHIKNQYNFKPGSPISSDDPYYRESPQVEDRMHVVVIVLDGTRFSVINNTDKQVLRESIKMARNLDLPVVLLLTNIDKMSERIAREVDWVFWSKAVKNAVYQASEMYGIRLAEIIPVQNFSFERKVCWKKCHLALQALEVMLNRAEETVRMMSEEGYAP